MPRGITLTIRSAPHGQRPRQAERNEEETEKNDGGKTGREAGQKKSLGFLQVVRRRTGQAGLVLAPATQAAFVMEAASETTWWRGGRW